MADVTRRSAPEKPRGREQPDPKQRLLPLIAVPSDGTAGDEPAFLRPERRVRRTRRTRLRRAVQAVQLGAVAFLGLSLVWSGYARAMASQRLKVGHLEVRGTHFLSVGEVRELLGPALGENILGLDMKALRGRLQASPWVEDAAVVRTLPDTLSIDVRERVPLALAELDKLYLMDAEGKLIDLYGPRTAGFDLPIVRGLGGIGPEARRDRAERAGALLRDLGPAAEPLSEITVQPSGDLRLVLRGAGEVVLMSRPPYRDAFLAFLGLRKELLARCPRTEYFDLRFRGHIFAKERVEHAVVPAATTPATLPGEAARPAQPAAEPGHPHVADTTTGAIPVELEGAEAVRKAGAGAARPALPRPPGSPEPSGAGMPTPALAESITPADGGR